VVRKRLSHLNNSISFDDLAKSVARIQIFYDELQETIISEKIKTQSFDLVSNMGGTLGLFLGLSFLSLIEIFEILFQVLFIYFDKSANNVINVKPI
jgi:acid-sensing ion channel 2